MTDYTEARRAMVDCQVRPSDVTRYAIIEAMLETPRELFVPGPLRSVAYAESEISMGNGRVLLPARTFAKMLECAQVRSTDLVLDLAPGLGYSSAVLSRLAMAVIAIEPDEAMARQASETLSKLEADNVVVTNGDPASGDAGHAPFDVIFINGGVEQVPEALVDQLKVGGRLVAVHIKGDLGQCCVTVKSPAAAAERRIFDAAAPVLAGFERAREFNF